MGSNRIYQLANQKGRIIPTFLLYVTVIALTAALAFKIIARPSTRYQYFNYKKSLNATCLLVYQKHFLGKKKLANWYKDCLRPQAEGLSRDTGASREDFVAEMRKKLKALGTSHLEIFTPQEDELTWSGQSSGDNGLRILPINGRFYISKVIPESSADTNGFLAGDQILSLGDQPFELASFSKYSGPVEILRKNIKRIIDIEALPLKVDTSPVLSELSDRTAWLQISSFRKEYIVNPQWQDLIQKAQAYPSLIVDLRGNLGGDFNSVVRALSSFVCQSDVSYGELVKPSTADGEGLDSVLKEDLSEDEFYNLLVESRSVRLQRFDGSVSCYKGRLTVLIDEDSASVSEIFATTIAEQLSQARVWGSRSRGDMLLGVWYPLEFLGHGYTLSIPEAVYRSARGFQIEGKGVTPERSLYYDESDVKSGEDSWLKAATK